MRLILVLVLALFASHRVARAEECFQVTTVQGSMEVAPGTALLCQRSLGESVDILYEAAKPLVEKPIQRPDYSEQKTVIPGDCALSKLVGSWPGIPEYNCTYKVRSVITFNNGSPTSTLTTDYWFLVWHLCG